MNIKEYLKTKNISLRELARKLEISPTYLSDLRDGKRKSISEKVYKKFCIIAPEIDIKAEEKIIYKMED